MYAFNALPNGAILLPSASLELVQLPSDILCEILSYLHKDIGTIAALLSIRCANSAFTKLAAIYCMRYGRLELGQKLPLYAASIAQSPHRSSLLEELVPALVDITWSLSGHLSPATYSLSHGGHYHCTS